jgi:hypothetical protein
MGCVNWIANDIGIDSFVYIDDTFGADIADDMGYYCPYDDFFPTAQMQTLCLWDDISLIHERAQQVWGLQLTVIGFEVDPNAMTITMSESQRAELIAGVLEFCRVPPGGRRLSLRKFQQMAVYLLLKPVLSHVYEKMEGKSNTDAPIYVNSGVVKDLVLQACSGVSWDTPT